MSLRVVLPHCYTMPEAGLDHERQAMLHQTSSFGPTRGFE